MIPFISELRLDSFLSLPPGAAGTRLEALNVLIGPNGSGKSNLIEAFELLRATPTNFASAIREGGSAAEWLWKGNKKPLPATLNAVLGNCPTTAKPLRYWLEFDAVRGRVEVLGEVI